ncbi:hypothetical protein TRIUR3_25061 [Triticum urartu]|uniref:Uncharacterized protein n=1 Tax=Triticum urartu TaxID=4572 RepID=M8A7L4_TRIUA|nr:hypothetical protein TRIUR3_25061 [Triticum urartu]
MADSELYCEVVRADPPSRVLVPATLASESGANDNNHDTDATAMAAMTATSWSRHSVPTVKG